ncbi:MAG: L,D-transpeptidase [Candidatus Acinetobacter avistercoris]|uniref:cell wall-recycling L,D-carboxypeptidase ElsL n=1 Tax=Acinetobacter sp. KS-LM10 TaxID=3120518 RepID=UPI001F871FC7|nr:L,D-transpeptidase [Candidatus Acinetobacter avistercoris]
MFSIDQADVVIDLASQTLSLPKKNKLYSISSGLNGIGEEENSGKTPRGWHKIEKKIGGEMPLNAVFKGRQWTGEIYDAELGQSHPERDWILSRILWLSGLEVGFNQGEGCDTFNRYIYIHGTPESEPMGIAKSHGCIRMHNAEVQEIYELLNEGDLVYLSE